jgi:hypothetical protein
MKVRETLLNREAKDRSFRRIAMAEEGIFPRSGLWDLQSKKDRRWNLQGQYAFSAPDSSPIFMPPEARQAVEEFAASLGEGPPDDLSCITRPYPTPGLRRLFDAHALLMTEKQGALHVLTQERGLATLSIDLAQGEISFSRPEQKPAHRFQAQFIGLLHDENACWQWGWVCEERGSMSPLVLKSVRKIREFGQQRGIPELTYSELVLGQGDDRPWFNGDYLAMVACHVCGADFTVEAPAPDAPELVMYWAVTAPDVLPKATSESVRMAYVIKEAMTKWAEALGGSDGREIVRAYSAQKNCTVSEVSNRRLRIDAPSGGHIFIDFQDSGGIYGIEIPAQPKLETKKVSWFERLFAGKGG